jgi:hypothetical protein
MSMKSLAIAAVAAVGLVAGTSSAVLAGDRDRGGPPGHQMQEYGSKHGYPGASGYAPGHERRATRDRDRDDWRYGDRDHNRRYSRDRYDRDRDRDTYRR